MIKPLRCLLSHFSLGLTISAMIKPLYCWLNHFALGLTIPLSLTIFFNSHFLKLLLKRNTGRLFSDLMIEHIVGKWIHNWLNRSTIVHCLLTWVFKPFLNHALMIYFLTTPFHTRTLKKLYFRLSFFDNLFHFANRHHCTVCVQSVSFHCFEPQ